jgi:hypothetical protein
MKKLLFGLAALVALAVSASPAAAQYPAQGGYGMPGQAGCQDCGGDPGNGWGFGIKDKFLGKLHGLFGSHGGRTFNTLPVVDPRSGNAGQLAYPHNPFFRGPRDYFMWDEK